MHLGYHRYIYNKREDDTITTSPPVQLLDSDTLIKVPTFGRLTTPLSHGVAS